MIRRILAWLGICRPPPAKPPAKGTLSEATKSRLLAHGMAKQHLTRKPR